MTIVIPAEWADAGQVVVPSLVAIAVLFFTLSYTRGKEIRDMRRAVYVRWLQFIDNVGTWAWEPQYANLDPERQQAAFKRQIKDIMAELELVASRRVWFAADEVFKVMSKDDVQAKLDGLFASGADADTIDLEMTVVIGPARDKVIRAMRRDVGVRRWTGWVVSRFALIQDRLRPSKRRAPQERR
jgi:hypothetical protein